MRSSLGLNHQVGQSSQGALLRGQHDAPHARAQKMGMVQGATLLVEKTPGPTVVSRAKSCRCMTRPPPPSPSAWADAQFRLANRWPGSFADLPGSLLALVSSPSFPSLGILADLYRQNEGFRWPDAYMLIAQLDCSYVTKLGAAIFSKTVTGPDRGMHKCH